MSITFANGTAYEQVPYTGPTLASGSFTLACRVKPAATASEQFMTLDMTGGSYAQLFIDNHGGAGPNNFAGFVTNDAFTIFAQATDPGVVSVGTWYHVAMTWDTTTTRLYVNGVLVNSVTPAATTRTGNWLNWQAVSDMSGSVQDAVIYNAALSADDIMQLYRARMPLRRTNLVEWLPMLTAPGLTDLSGVGGNANLNGTAPTAGPDDAAIPWGVGISPQAFRLAPTTPISASGTQLQTGSANVTSAKAVVASGTQLQTGAANAGLSKDLVASGTQLQTGSVTVTGGSIAVTASGTQLQTGSVATTLSEAVVASGTQLQTGSVIVTGGSSAPPATPTNGGQGRRFGNRLMPAFSRRG